MKLKRLIVQGFKSFRERQVIHFNSGITGIVGPNGCGKSNIVDALFWVMGEQSAKHLRGDSMKDLIFAGSEKYSPSSFAEVTLVLENRSGKLVHIGRQVAELSEIQLTRKLYRNGESEYRINDQPCRLRDIQEVFMDTGAGAKSYSVIAQGEINRLVQAKPMDRRSIVEEVAGITKFKMRKRDSVRKMEMAQQNLKRLQDLQGEIEKNLQILSKQAEKAKRARELKEKVRTKELSVSAHRVFHQLETIKEMDNKMKEGDLGLEQALGERERLEISLENERTRRTTWESQVEDLQGEYNEVSQRLATEEERLKHLKEGQRAKGEDLKLRRSEMDEMKEMLESRHIRLSELKREIETVESQKGEGLDFAGDEAKLADFKEVLQTKKDLLHHQAQEVAQRDEQTARLQQQEGQNAFEMKRLSKELEDIVQEIEVVEEHSSNLLKSIVAATRERDEVLKNLERQEKLEADRRVELEQRDQKIQRGEKRKQEITREFILTQTKRDSLRQERGGGTQARQGGVQFLKDGGESSFCLIEELIESKDLYAKGVQRLIQEYLPVLVSKESAGGGDRKVFHWLENNSKQDLNLWGSFLSESKAEEEESHRVHCDWESLGLKGVLPLAEVIQVPEKYASRLAPLWEGLYLAPEFDSQLWEKIDSHLPFHFKGIARFDGKAVIRNLGKGKIVEQRGSGDKSLNLLEQKNEILRLEKQLTSLRREREALELSLGEQKREQACEQEQGRSRAEELKEIRQECEKKSSLLNTQLLDQEFGNQRLKILGQRKTEISKKRFKVLEREDELKKEQSVLEAKKEKLLEQHQGLEKEVEALEEDYTKRYNTFLEEKTKAGTWQERSRLLLTQREDIKNQMGLYEKRISSGRELIDRLDDDLSKIQVTLQDLTVEVEKRVQEKRGKEKVLGDLKGQLTGLVQQMKEREDRVRSLSHEINQGEKNRLTWQAKWEQALEQEEKQTRDTFEKYRVDLREILGEELAYSKEDYQILRDLSGMYVMETESGVQRITKEPYTFSRIYGQNLREAEQKMKRLRAELSQLGEINAQAIEDFDRQKKRYDFLSHQEIELKRSLENLEKAIEHIDVKSKERFKEAFEEIDSRFKKVFPIIFGGGKAELKIIGDISDMDCGVDIIAQPPGKKMQNINLMSGGEKALTAMSLIFSIFLVKPSPFCLLDEVDAPLDDVNVERFNELLRELSDDSQFILITHNKKTMELNDTLYGVTMQEPGVSKTVSVQLH